MWRFWLFGDFLMQAYIFVRFCWPLFLHLKSPNLSHLSCRLVSSETKDALSLTKPPMSSFTCILPINRRKLRLFWATFVSSFKAQHVIKFRSFTVVKSMPGTKSTQQKPLCRSVGSWNKQIQRNKRREMMEVTSYLLKIMQQNMVAVHYTVPSATIAVVIYEVEHHDCMGVAPDGSSPTCAWILNPNWKLVSKRDSTWFNACDFHKQVEHLPVENVLPMLPGEKVLLLN